MSYGLQFIDSTRYMVSSLSNLVDNLSARIHKIMCANCNKCWFVYAFFKGVLIELKCLGHNRNYQKKFNENLKKKFANTYKFAKRDISNLFCCSEMIFVHINT